MFIRTEEDFICENCGVSVEGNGYTNHCPSCLWSKHVDKDPGDREEDCLGMMKPIAILTKGGVPVSIVHKCVKCGFERPAPIAKNDNWDELRKLM